MVPLLHSRVTQQCNFIAHRVTNETYRWVSDARFHPSGSKVIATKWYTSERSLGAGEGWEYGVRSLDELQNTGKQVNVGSGSRLVGRSLPLGWSTEDYGNQQIGPEQFIWNGDDTLIYSKNVVDETVFEYSKGTRDFLCHSCTKLSHIDVHKGIYAIFQHNLTTGNTQLLVPSTPGGASRPELSHDSRTLAFVRRIRDKQALVLK